MTCPTATCPPTSCPTAQSGPVRAIRSHGPAPLDRCDAQIQLIPIELMPMSVAQTTIAGRAWRTFGPGLRPARLNFGDCLAYARATARSEPRLFKANAFAQTGIEPALKD
jgi:ribonuclease VapC